MKAYKKKKDSIFTYFNNEFENKLYWISILAIILVGFSYLLRILIFKYFDLPEFFSSCIFKEILGIPCPGCGGTRAFICFIKGQWIQSIYYNAFSFFFSFVYSLFFITQTLQRITNGKIKGLKWHNFFLKTGLFILLLQYILKLCIPDYMSGI